MTRQLNNNNDRSIIIKPSPRVGLHVRTQSTPGTHKKQRHHFADKGLYSQSYGFSSSHVWM